jgi:acetoacetyl-CoA synthetase
MTDLPLWQPSAERVAATRLSALIARVRESAPSVTDATTLHQWSVDDPGAFWRAVWRECSIVGDDPGGPVVDPPDAMPGARFFPNARVSFAENVLGRSDDAPAIVFRCEDGSTTTLSRRDLHEEVSRAIGCLRDAGVGPGDRVAGYVPNIPMAVVAALATASLGAIWSSCSPDFGVQGVLDRFGQIAPKVLWSADGHQYNGTWHSSLGKLREIVRGLPSVERTIVVPYARDGVARPDVSREESWSVLRERYRPSPIAFERWPFNQPLYILYSSGTTGVPKCILHGAGGTLLQHVKEHQFHCDIRPGDRAFYFTTCGWMMWNWLVTVLASGATILLYDGSPFYPGPRALFDFADDTGMTFFGTSAKYLAAIEKAGLSPVHSHGLVPLRTMTSTGSPLSPESFDYVYTRVKRDVHLASISGGTDIVGCFVSGNPNGPVWRGEIQARCLGMAVDVFDERGRPVRQEKGELVCTRPFPSMPLGFWNDPGDRKYRAAYFERFPGVWCHGDYAELTAHGGIVIHGRSDAVLNPGGVRIGTAEIYRQVEQLHEVVECLAVGQHWQHDERVVLFVRLREGLVLDEALVARIKDHIRRNTTPRHVPAKVVQVTDIPRTRSGKIVELAVRDLLHGREVRNREALANPEALSQFVNRRDLET